MSINTTNFDDIEQQKENIEPVREGRSAASLAKAFGQNPLDARTAQSTKRQEFEAQIAESAELDDPIEPYLDYIKWIHNEYPQGQNSESGLLQLLERCTSDFRDASFYKDDSRYLRVWMEYAKYSDAPKEIFTYLSRKSIGRGLSLFYEEYAAYLESVEKRAQANEVYQLGIEANARPLERLRRRYREFEERLAANPADPNEPSSPVMPTVRPALAQKGFMVSGVEGEEEGDDGQAPTRREKMSVFTDTGESEAAVAAASSSGGWDSIGSLAFRKKENTIEAKQWAGEKMKQASDTKASKSLSVFRDAAAVAPAPGKRAENIAVAMDFINVNGEEFCLEEVLARSRRIYHNIYPRPEKSDDDSIVPLKGGDTPVKAPRSPTMTLHTKAATDEVYEMFNQPLKGSSDDEESGDDGGYYDTDFTETSRYDNNNNNEVNEQYDYPQTPAREPLAFSMPAMTPIAEATETLTHHIKQAMLTYNNNPLIQERVVNPIQPQVQLQVLGLVDPALDTYPGYNKSDEQVHKQDAIKRALKKGEEAFVKFKSEGYSVQSVLGEGGFGSVYLAETELGDLKALKVQRETNPWEYYILRQLRTRLGQDRNVRSIVHASSLYIYTNETWMCLDYLSQGTILDLVNMFRRNSDSSGGLEECVAMFFAIELLRVVESVHAAGILHCDIKPDNVMVRLTPVADHEWSKYYSADGSNSWSNKGLMVIDFGRAADMTVLDPDVQFTADWKMDNQDCAEMRQGENWTYEADYYGVAAVIHLMLFGKFITTSKDGDGMHRPATNFKRYWQKDLWEEVFSVLLNPKFHGVLPIMSIVQDCRVKLAHRLEQICEGNGVSLKSCLKQLERELWTSSNSSYRKSKKL